MMRVASALLVAVLLSTCAISGTFAKYVTEGSGSDTARVAKFGVTVTATEICSKKRTLKYDDSFTLAENTVVSTDKVVARYKRFFWAELQSLVLPRLPYVFPAQPLK